jgi:hypothetical protein
VAETDSAIAAWFRRGHAAVLLKAPWSLAGRGHLKLPPGGRTAAQTAWIEGTLSEQQGLVVEPWLDRVADFSAHYDVAPGRPPPLSGMIRLVNDSAGRFVACVASRSFHRLLPPGAARALQQAHGLHFYKEVLPRALAEAIGDSGFRGCLGVDAFLHRDAGGRVLLRPVVEINPRATMGRVALEARRLAAPDSPVAWRIFYQRHAREAGHSSLAGYAAQIRVANPLVLRDRRIVSGAICLNDPAKAEKFLGVLFVGRQATAFCE